MDTQKHPHGCDYALLQVPQAKPHTSAKSPMPIMGHHTTLDMKKIGKLSHCMPCFGRWSHNYLRGGYIAYNHPIGNLYHLYTTYILPIGWLYIPYHLLGEAETTIDVLHVLAQRRDYGVPSDARMHPSISNSGSSSHLCWWGRRRILEIFPD